MGIGSITVVNKRTHKGNAIYIGRGSVFGNPYPLPQYTREQSIGKYKADFVEHMKWEHPMKDALRSIAMRVLAGEHVYLACYCAPLACHGDVLKEFLDTSIATYLKKQDSMHVRITNMDKMLSKIQLT